jgi:hypothetical protein
MTDFKRYLGIDFIDLLIQAGVTAMALAVVGISDGPEELMPTLVAASLIILGVRRHRALKQGTIGLSTDQMAAARLEEMEERIAALETGDVRLAELEERVEFAERMLASGERAILPREQPR